MTTDEDAVERKKILNLIYSNDYKELKDLRITNKNLNWLMAHHKTDLDDQVSPLACAAFLGRTKIAELLLENPYIDINMATEENGYSPLCAAAMSGNYEVAKLLAENGADVNYQNQKQ